MRPGLTFATLLAAAVAFAAPASAQKGDAGLCATGPVPEALAACTRLIDQKREPAGTLARAHADRAGLWRGIGAGDKGLADYDAAIRLDPKLARAYVGRAALLTQRGERDRAIADDEAAIKLDAAFARAYLNRGANLAVKGERQRALADFDTAIRLDPKDAVAHFSRGALRDAMGQDDLALADYDAALGLDATLPEAFNNRGNLWDRKGDATRAMADLDAAIRLNPGYATAYVNRGNLWEKRGDLDRALADHEAAIRAEPAFAAAHNGKAWVLFRLGRADEGLPAADRALALNPANAAALDTRGRIREALGEFDLASTDITRSLELDPGQGEVRESLARIKSRLEAAAASPAGAVRADAGRTRERRIALVIGNSAYENVAKLKNAEGDAQAVADKLRSVGFDAVQVATNLKREALVETFGAFAREAESAEWAVVYFAGHGMEVNGINWLVPTDAALKADRDVPFQAVPLDQALVAVEGARRMRLVILDACRDNPFLAKMTRLVASRSLSRGLAQIEPSRGTLVAFSAKPGQVALDGDGANSPFVSALVKHLGTPGLEIDRLFRRVRDEVLRTTADKQEPWSNGTLPDEDFFFSK
jgi:tetratricopeptide (TPR) repeat protein